MMQLLASIHLLSNISGLPESTMLSEKGRDILHQLQHPIHPPARECPGKHQNQKLVPTPISWLGRSQVRPRGTKTVLITPLCGQPCLSWKGIKKRCTLFWALMKVGFSSSSSFGGPFPSSPEEGQYRQLGRKTLVLPLGCNKSCASQPVLPSPLLASAAAGGKNGAVLLHLVQLQPIETLISLHAIEDMGRKWVTSTCNYYVMQLE